MISVILFLQGVWKSFSNVKDVGLVQVRVLRAEGLSAADVNGNFSQTPQNTVTVLVTLAAFNVKTGSHCFPR